MINRSDLLDATGRDLDANHMTDLPFTRDRFHLKCAFGGGGYRKTEERALWLNSVKQTAQQSATGAPWEILQPIMGTTWNSDNRSEWSWRHLLNSNTRMGRELLLEIQRLRDLQEAERTIRQAPDTEPRQPVFRKPDDTFGIEEPKLHKSVFDAIQIERRRTMKFRATKLPTDDLRRHAFIQPQGDKISTSRLSMPPGLIKHSHRSWASSAQNMFGMKQSACSSYTDRNLRNTASNPTRVDAYGHNTKNVNLGGDANRYPLHNAVQNKLSEFLDKAQIKHRGGSKGMGRKAAAIFNDLIDVPGAPAVNENIRKGMIPDLVIHGEDVTKADPQVGGQEIGDSRTLADFKTLGYNSQYRRGLSSCSHTGVQQKKASCNRHYHNTGKILDETIYSTPPGSRGPIMERVMEHNGGEILVPTVGPFGECSLDLHSLLATIATRLAEIRGRVICKKPSVLKQGYLQWMRRELVVLIDIGWSRQMFGALESFHTSNHRTSTGNDEARRNTAEFLHGRRWL